MKNVFGADLFKNLVGTRRRNDVDVTALHRRQYDVMCLLVILPPLPPPPPPPNILNLAPPPTNVQNLPTPIILHLQKLILQILSCTNAHVSNRK